MSSDRCRSNLKCAHCRVFSWPRLYEPGSAVRVHHHDLVASVCWDNPTAIHTVKYMAPIVADDANAGGSSLLYAEPSKRLREQVTPQPSQRPSGNLPDAFSQPPIGCTPALCHVLASIQAHLEA
jgi:hypothetical protein